MATLVFVHGTGVRGAEYAKTLQLITQQAAAHGGHDVVGVNWGDTVGVKLLRGGASIPGYRKTGGIAVAELAEISEADEVDELWQVLYADPLYELRLLAAGPVPRLVPGELPPGQALADAVAQLGSSDALVAILESAHLEIEFAEAKRRVVESDEFRGALRVAGSGTTDAHYAVARAIAAYMEPDEVTALEFWSIRDAVVDQMSDDLGARVLGDRTKHFTSVLVQMGLRRLDPVLARRRGKISDAASSKVGDILSYTLAGDQARAMITSAALGADEPVYLLGHSLGGIMSFDVLCMGDVAVGGLVTVGSQAPYMYEIGAVRGLSHPDPLPAHFPRWLNFYDKSDLLSYLAEPIFGSGARDIEIQSGAPFPVAHSAYWSSDAMWDAIAEFVR